MNFEFRIMFRRGQKCPRCVYPIRGGRWSSENGKLKSEYITATDKTQLAYRCAHLFYARAYSSEWGLFGHIARSAFRRTPSGREVVT